MVREPVTGAVKTRLVPPLSEEEARNLYLAFLHDLTARVRASRLRPTIFVAGEVPATTAALFPPGWPLTRQQGSTLGDRLTAAFAHLLDGPATHAVIIGSDSPDLPLVHIKRAFRLLKHKDLVLGPALDGGYYLIGLRAPAPALFAHIAWGGANVFADTIRAAQRAGLSLALTPPWYDVDDAAGLSFLHALCRARRAAGGERLPHTERFLDTGGE